MRTKIFMLAVALALSSCKSQKASKSPEWVESQTLCVYWSPNFDKRDTLSAINFTVKSESEDIFNTQNFYLKVGDNKYNLKKIRSIDKGEYFLQGLKLECRTLYEYFEEDIYAEDGPCYENSLYKMVIEGELSFGSRTKIRRPNNFKITRGLKDK